MEINIQYSDNWVEKGVGNNLLGNDLLGDDLLSNNSLAHINSNINMDTKTKSNLDKDIISGNLLEKNSEINIEDLFQ